MKKNVFKRFAAAAAACTVMAAAMPVIPGTASAEGNIVKNSTFDKNTSGWDIYKESGGSCYITWEDGRLAMHVVKQGKLGYSCQLFYDIVKLYENGVYRFSYDVSSTIPRVVEAMIQLNGGDYHSYTWKKLEVYEETTHYEYTFTMQDTTDIMAKMCFNCGIEEEDGEMPEHIIYFDNVELELIDDSNVDYDSIKPYEPGIITNQIGFRPNDQKQAAFKKSGGGFTIVDAETGKTAYKGRISMASKDALSGDMLGRADFTDFNVPGKYIIKADGLDDSYPFEIAEDVYMAMNDELVRMLYLQRCGTKIEDKDFGHAACHTADATIYHTNKKIDVSGGWHDAGDYGRYVVPAAKAVADLMYAYQEDPEIFSDNIGIPESGNGIPDILDEVRYELEWMMKMQDPEDGGVYHKVSCANFPGFIMPEKETEPLIVMPKTVTSTADFAASMAMAYEFYKDIDAEFSAKCLEAGKKAYTWAKANPKELYLKNPDDVVTGAYEDKTADDEFYWAACQLYRATGDDTYMKDVLSAKKGLDWSTVGDYGNIAIITMDGIDKNSNEYKRASQTIIDQADELAAAADKSAYGVVLDKFNWGSNMTIANYGIIMSYAYQLTGDSKYLAAADKQLNYLLGNNANGVSFVTGYGTVSPEHPHHRPSIALDKSMPGMLVGGVNQNLEDSAAKAYCVDNTPAKCWVDHDQSYSTNEITIYWNSPLTYLLAMTESTKDVKPPVTEKIEPPVKDGVWGDVNGDGDTTVADAAAILLYLANGDKHPLDTDSRILGDVDMYGDGITPKDAMAIQRYVAGIITSLPASVTVLAPAETTAPAATKVTSQTTTATVTKAPVTTAKSTTKAPVTTAKSTTKAPVTTVKSTTKAPVTTVKSTTKAPVTTVKSTTKAPVTTVKSTTKALATTAKSTTKAPVTTAKPATKAPATTTAKSAN